MSKTKILVIEDDGSLAAFFSKCLRESNYDVVEKLDNSKDALNFLENNTLVDIVLMDIALKGKLNGIESAKAIKEKFDIPIVFVSGNTTKEVYEKAREVKPSGYILKPIKKHDLIRSIDIAVQNYSKNSHKQLITKEIQFRSIIEEIGERGFKFFESYLNNCKGKHLVISTNTRFNIINQPEDSYDIIINLKKVNNTRRVNKFFEAVNYKLPMGGIFIGHAETKGLKKRMILSKYPWGIDYILYFFYFFIKRVWPKLPVLKHLYFFITKGRNRSISRAEVLGRLISCGFEIIQEDFIDANLFFIAKKTDKPAFDMNPSYSLIFGMKRVGKDGKIINVYKLRTMHPYSEYLQKYIFDLNQLADGGKIKNDFRINTFGRFARRFWLDELPMIINVFKGDLKIVGVRPLSKHFYGLYTKELKKKRIKTKPGLVPPYYAQYPCPKDIEDVMKNENEYLDAYFKSPFLTDCKYFFRAFYNIIFKKARSK